MLRLTWAPHIMAIAGAVLAFLFAPNIDRKHPPSGLAPFFGGVLAALVAVAIALYLLQCNKDNTRVFRFLGVSTVLYFAIATVAAVLGLLPLPYASFRFIFTVTVAGGAAVLTTFVLVAATNVLEQRRAARNSVLDEYAKRKHN